MIGRKVIPCILQRLANRMRIFGGGSTPTLIFGGRKEGDGKWNSDSFRLSEAGHLAEFYRAAIGNRFGVEIAGNRLGTKTRTKLRFKKFLVFRLISVWYLKCLKVLANFTDDNN